jgi:hypothetical protein
VRRATAGLLAAALALPAAAQGLDGAPSQAELESRTPGGRRLSDLEPEDVLDAARAGPVGEDTPLPDTQAVVAALGQGLAWLLDHQNLDGSWGGWGEAGPWDEFWSNIHTHKAWITATTGLAVMSLLEHPDDLRARRAVQRGLDYVLGEPAPQRPSDWDVDNTWGYVYGLDMLGTVLLEGRFTGTEREARARAKADEYVEKLAAYQTPAGGWGYYDFDSLAQRPSWATSFQTAAALGALAQARDAGVPVPGRVVTRAMDALRRCRLANGAWSYSVEAVPHLGLEWIDNVKGSLSRIQACHYALLRCGANDVSRADVLAGLDQLFEHHRFLDVAYQKPVPHETYYLNSGYFYFFGHYYAARLLDTLEPAERARYAARLAREVIKRQEADGSMWDYHMNAYGRPYGTAFGTMTLTRTLPER